MRTDECSGHFVKIPPLVMVCISHLNNNKATTRAGVPNVAGLQRVVHQPNERPVHVTWLAAGGLRPLHGDPVRERGASTLFGWRDVHFGRRKVTGAPTRTQVTDSESAHHQTMSPGRCRGPCSRAGWYCQPHTVYLMAHGCWGSVQARHHGLVTACSPLIDDEGLLPRSQSVGYSKALQWYCIVRSDSQ